MCVLDLRDIRGVVLGVVDAWRLCYGEKEEVETATLAGGKVEIWKGNYSRTSTQKFGNAGVSSSLPSASNGTCTAVAPLELR